MLPYTLQDLFSDRHTYKHTYTTLQGNSDMFIFNFLLLLNCISKCTPSAVYENDFFLFSPKSDNDTLLPIWCVWNIVVLICIPLLVSLNIFICLLTTKLYSMNHLLISFTHFSTWLFALLLLYYLFIGVLLYFGY